MPQTSLPSFVTWSSFPFEGELRVKQPEEPVGTEPPRIGEDAGDCPKCHTPDDAYIWVNENWRVRSMDRPSGLPMILILESRSHLDLGDLPNRLAAELGVMTVRLERAIRSIDGVARVHVNRWGDGAAHLHLWFMARPYGYLQLRGTFLTLWDEILPPILETTWRENLAMVAAWLAEFGGEPLAKPPRIDWKAPSSFSQVIPPDEVAADGDQALVPDDGPDTAPGPGPATADDPAQGVDAAATEAAPAAATPAADPAPPVGAAAPAVPAPAAVAGPAPDEPVSATPGGTTDAAADGAADGADRTVAGAASRERENAQARPAAS